ncbi:MAG: hypothetical protein ABI045_01220 [Flavobacteriales bacterium]
MNTIRVTNLSTPINKEPKDHLKQDIFFEVGQHPTYTFKMSKSAQSGDQNYPLLIT